MSAVLVAAVLAVWIFWIPIFLIAVCAICEWRDRRITRKAERRLADPLDPLEYAYAVLPAWTPDRQERA